MTIRREDLLQKLELDSKLDPDFESIYHNVDIDGKKYDVFVKPSQKHRGHRILIQCHCGRVIPFGRMQQHVCHCARCNSIDNVEFGLCTSCTIYAEENSSVNQ
jgi:hypothetical protein